jgi:ribosome-binding ATPase YchF (GTP1/OBG family)
MKIGLIGYQGSGKSTLFEWLTGVPADAAKSHTGQSAMAPVPEPRVDALCGVYQPKKITYAALELIDTPGLNRSHEGNAARLGLIRDCGCLIMVVAAFDGGSAAAADLSRFREDLLLADMEIVSGRVDRLRDSVKKPRPNREQEMAELASLEQVFAAMEAAKPLAESAMTADQLKATRSFRLLTEKPALIILNVADDESDPAARAREIGGERPVLAVRVGLECELARMTPEERAEFERDLGIAGSEREQVLRTILDVSGQMLYFTAGEKEVRTWMMRAGGTALEAADNIHSDLARGFIRAEVMTASDLVRLGSEREVKAHNLVRQEPKDYVVRDDDILNIRFSV